ncbi:uncharacterized protein LOC131888743 [Tigriopus californicus]|nr:uncharacterized protein LOC131888743 [Tigriopus californicus]
MSKPKYAEKHAVVESEDYGSMFAKFCESSTIHGTYFWGESRSTLGKSFWVLIVLFGVISAALIINNSFIAWKDNPVITSVTQIPIEQVPFPSVTICPIGDTRFGFPEFVANTRPTPDGLNTGLAMIKALSLIHTSRRTRQHQIKGPSFSNSGSTDRPSFENSQTTTQAKANYPSEPDTFPGDKNPNEIRWNDEAADGGGGFRDDFQGDWEEDCFIIYCQARRGNLTYTTHGSGRADSVSVNEPQASAHNCTLINEFETLLNSIRLGPTSEYSDNDDSYGASGNRSTRERGEANYGQKIVQMIYERLGLAPLTEINMTRLEGDPLRMFPTLGMGTGPENLPTCAEIREDLAFLKDLDSFLGGPSNALDLSQTPPGSIMSWVFAHLPDNENATHLYHHFFPRSKFPELYSEAYGTFEDMPLPDLVHYLNDHGEIDSARLSNITNHFRLNLTKTLLNVMRFSIHPPHVAEVQEDFSIRQMPQPLFPFCWFRDQLDSGIKYGPYDEHYCHSFQTTFNDHGLCYTFNNFDLGFDDRATNEAVQVRKVQGCGKSKGLRVIIDNHKFATLGSRNTPGSKFQVYVTVPGVVTHKVPFKMDPTYHGEHSIYLHGIHYIDSSIQFKAWNKDMKACYFPDDRQLNYFSIYTQDNCLLECRLNKIALICQCAPWYLNQTQFPACGLSGNECFRENLANYQDDLQDRTDCDCKNDCEGIHIFSTMNRYSYSDTTATDSDLWWDAKTKTGRLANYLLDPEHLFMDPWTKNLTKMMHDLDDSELATKRFREDISVLNFFFDTPIITRITQEMRITVFDQISAVGGTLGLFTGVSLITFAEVFYWLLRFIFASGRQRFLRSQDVVQPLSATHPKSRLHANKEPDLGPFGNNFQF